VNIVQRETWGAVHPDGAGPAPLPAREVWLHHSVTVAPDMHPPYDDEDAAMRLLERIGQQRFGQGVSYTFAVMPTGRVYEGHSVDRLGAHLAKRNGIARGIVLVGNYDTAAPMLEQIEGTAQLLAHGWRQGWWTRPALNGGHQQAPGASTACPGHYAMALIGAINDRAGALAAAPPPEEDDMYDNNAREELLRELREIRRLAGLPVGWAGAVPNEQAALRKLWAEPGAIVVDVDEKALAVDLAVALGPRIDVLPDTEVARLASAFADEQARRLSRPS
jgi:hypothetical protein